MEYIRQAIEEDAGKSLKRNLVGGIAGTVDSSQIYPADTGDPSPIPKFLPGFLVKIR